ncbi:MAG: nucleotide exchange factor GrpE [Kiritimatiellia bacterium]|nr:nucleotide exchange factor GrpE [Kiritimatiellia bacterium]
MSHSKKKQNPEADPASSEPGPEAAMSADMETQAATEEKTVESDLVALTDRLLRLQADFDNYRKRIQRDQVETYRRSLESLMSELLPILDHFELGLKNAAALHLPETMRQGFVLVYDQLQSALSKFGLSPIDAPGQPFDPALHESIAAIPSDQPRDTVLEQTRRGYRLGDQLLRPAQVVLAAESTPTPES